MRQLLCILPFTQVANKQLPQDTLLFPQFHLCEVALRMMLLVLAWFQLSQSHGNLWGKPWGVQSFLQHRFLPHDWVSPAKSYVDKILLFPHTAATTTVWGKAAMVPALKVPCGKSSGNKERSLRKCGRVWAVLLCSHLIDPVAFPDLPTSKKKTP